MARPGEHVGDRRVGVGRDVEVVGQVALRVEVDRQHLAGPTRRNTSHSVRVVVVLPVPPFWERTVIVVAIAGAIIAGRGLRRLGLAVPSLPARSSVAAPEDGRGTPST